MKRSIVVLLLLAHVILLAWQGSADGPGWDEVAHFAAGLEHWSHGRFELYTVNPPLVRLVATLPSALFGETLYPSEDPVFRSPGVRGEFIVGRGIAHRAGPRYFSLLTAARWACISFSLLGAWICLLWSNELFGEYCGLLALALWCFSPTLLAYGHLITPDLGSAGMGVAALYLLRRWLLAPTFGRACIAGAALGLAELTKSTWIVLLPLYPVFWWSFRRKHPERRPRRRYAKEGLQVIGMLVLAVWTLNLGYGFEGSFKPLGKFLFISQPLGGRPTASGTVVPGNRFNGTWVANVPVPAPENYLIGIDYIKWEYERGYWSYLNGQWRHGGWWYYYLYAMLVKEPLGTWGLGVLALGCVALRRRVYAAAWREEMLLLVPAIVVIALVSSQTGFNHHLRYVVPAYPFLFILISRVGKSFESGHRSVGVAVCLLLGWSIFSSLSVFPHSMSYFNELVGGPKGGPSHLGNSNADWGQDLLYLKKWYDAHLDARPLYLGYDVPLIDPRVMVGIDWRPIPVGPSGEMAVLEPPGELGPKPGWYAVSVNWVHDREHRYDYFHDLVPVDWVGYTMPVYHITLEQANALRRRYGMAELPNDPEAPPATAPDVPATGASPTADAVK